MLRELTLWLTTGALNARAEGSLRFPEGQNISELRLSFIRVAPESGRIKLILTSLSPLASGLAALWAISAALFPVSGSMLPAPTGSVSDLGAAITSLTQTANFWLWLYIVFTIANCSFPALPVKLSAAEKVLPLLALLAICFGTWRAFNTANPAVALAIEGLLRGLALILAQVTLLNISCVLVLGALEAAIERIGSRSATFRDGRLITLDDDEPKTAATAPAPARPQPAAGSAVAQAAPAKSIYDLRLPIPGPPGREPISRQAVAVVNMMDMGRQPVADSVEDRRPTAPSKLPRAAEPRPSAIDEGAPAKPMRISDDSGGESMSTFADLDHDSAAPFARPFATQSSPAGAADDWLEAPDEVDGEPFSRPFVKSAGSDQRASADDAAAATSEISAADAIDGAAENALKNTAATRGSARRGASQTRPAPKPSQKERRAGGKEAAASSELEYEDLSDADAFDQDDGYYDDDV